jgi:hypothetical protein
VYGDWTAGKGERGLERKRGWPELGMRTRRQERQWKLKAVWSRGSKVFGLDVVPVYYNRHRDNLQWDIASIDFSAIDCVFRH